MTNFPQSDVNMALSICQYHTYYPACAGYTKAIGSHHLHETYTYPPLVSVSPTNLIKYIYNVNACTYIK